jgi:hypothetical protein
MRFVRGVCVPSGVAWVLWACATSEIPETESATGGGSAGGRGGTSSTSGGFRPTGGTGTGGVFGGSSGGSLGSGGLINGGASSGGASSGASSGGTTNVGGGGTGGGVPGSVLERASVILYYETNEANATSNKIHMRLFLENKSVDPLPLASVAIRYWMTSEVLPPKLHNYYAGQSIQGETQTFVEDGADSYVELTFTGNTVTRGADLNSSEMQLDLDGGSYDQSDDWSWQPAYTTRQPHDKVTVYLADKLIWGCEPSGSCAGDGAGGAGGGGAGGGAGAGGESTGGAAGAPTTTGGAGGSDGGSSAGGAGGEEATGGTAATGGNASTGGTATTGGAETGGTTTGGNAATGGTVATGGTGP